MTCICTSTCKFDCQATGGKESSKVTVMVHSLACEEVYFGMPDSRQLEFGAYMELELLVDLESLLVELVLDCNLTDSRAIKVVEPVDVVLDAVLGTLDGSDDEEVLQVGVGREGRVLEHDLLQQLDELAL
eukprot:scaffold31631_cov27-Prasinocladus_malaysianus.AAC.1